MFSTYKQAVLRHYLSQKNNKVLPLRLQALTPAGVKRHLLQYLSKNYDARKDEQILEMFFDHQDNLIAYARAVNRIDIGKFKPVIRFLQGITPNPEDKQVHLAALLLDFERPYEFGREYSSDEIEESGSVGTDDREGWETATEIDVVIGGGAGQSYTRTDIDLPVAPVEGEEDIEKGDVVSPNGEVTKEVLEVNERPKTSEEMETPNTKSSKRVLIPLLILLAITIGFVLKDVIADPMGKQCMYWSDDRYVAVACDAMLPEGTEKIALDTFLLAHFRKITRPDTITDRSIGKIWYLKHQKKFDYFTVKGVHPVHGRRLSRLSDWIYRNEIASERLVSAGR